MHTRPGSSSQPGGTQGRRKCSTLTLGPERKRFQKGALLARAFLSGGWSVHLLSGALPRPDGEPSGSFLSRVSHSCIWWHEAGRDVTPFRAGPGPRDRPRNLRNGSPSPSQVYGGRTRRPLRSCLITSSRGSRLLATPALPATWNRKPGAVVWLARACQW